MQAPSGFGSWSPGTHQVPSLERPQRARERASSLKGGRSSPGFKSPATCQPYLVVSRESCCQEGAMEENGEVVTRANMDCPEACLLPGGRWHSPLPPVTLPPWGRGSAPPGPLLCPREGSSLAASYKLVTAWGGASASPSESEFGPPCLTSSRDCSDVLEASFRPRVAHPLCTPSPEAGTEQPLGVNPQNEPTWVRVSRKDQRP